MTVKTVNELLPICYADVFKIPLEISRPFMKLVDNWIKNNGTEWTVDRLKSMKLDFIRMKPDYNRVVRGLLNLLQIALKAL